MLSSTVPLDGCTDIVTQIAARDCYMKSFWIPENSRSFRSKRVVPRGSAWQATLAGRIQASSHDRCKDCALEKDKMPGRALVTPDNFAVPVKRSQTKVDTMTKHFQRESYSNLKSSDLNANIPTAARLIYSKYASLVASKITAVLVTGKMLFNCSQSKGGQTLNDKQSHKMLTLL